MQENVPFSSNTSTTTAADRTSDAVLYGQLSGIELLDNLSDGELKLLQPFLRPMLAMAGTTIVERGGSDPLFGIVLDGQASLRLAGNSPHALVQGMCFGEGTLVDDQPHLATVIAEIDTQLVLLDRDDLRRLSVSQPIIAVRLLHKICRHLCQQLRQPGGPVMECLG